MLHEEIIIQTDSNGRKKEKYIKKQRIGSGGFAKCYLVINSKNNQKFAAKVIDAKELKDKLSRNKVMQEVDIHKDLDHKNVVKFYDLFEFEGEMYLILELCQNNSLKQFIRSRVRITEFQAKCYIHQIIEGIQYIHQKNIVHRDIKLGNIFLNYKMQIKIGDFGLSTRLKNSRQRKFTTCGTPNYIAPEILRQTGHSFQADIWALGIILYAMLIGKPPFQSDSVQNTYKKIKSNSFDFPKHIPVSDEAKSLIKAILEPNPKNRLTFDQIKKHQFLNKETQKIPKTMPSYTISIPPQNNYLKQYVSEKSMKLAVYPRKIQEKRPSIMDQYTDKGDQSSKIKKMNRVVSADKNLLKNVFHHHQYKQISSLNRGRYIKALRVQSLSRSKKQKLSLPKIQRPPQAQRLASPRRYQEDGTQIICYYDMSQKYGIGYLLSNGNYGVSFNDGTSLTKINFNKQKEQDNNPNFIYYNSNQTYIDKLPDSLLKKGQILKICEQKLQAYRQNHILIPYLSQVYVKKWIKYNQCFILKMSNSILQFFWDSDSVTLRSYKWIKWRINNEEGEGAIGQKNLPAHTSQKIEQVRSFLRKYSEQSKRKTQR